MFQNVSQCRLDRRGNVQITCTPQNEEEPTATFFHRLPGAIRAVARFISSSRADLVMRGFAISFRMLARVAAASSFLGFFFIEQL
jgi:hypothetical protein